MLSSRPTSLSSTAWRYSSQNLMTFRFGPVSSTSVFGMYDFEQPATPKASRAETSFFIGATLFPSNTSHLNRIPHSSSRVAAQVGANNPQVLRPSETRPSKTTPRHLHRNLGGLGSDQRQERSMRVHGW